MESAGACKVVHSHRSKSEWHGKGLRGFVAFSQGTHQVTKYHFPSFLLSFWVPHCLTLLAILRAGGLSSHWSGSEQRLGGERQRGIQGASETCCMDVFMPCSSILCKLLLISSVMFVIFICKNNPGFNLIFGAGALIASSGQGKRKLGSVSHKYWGWVGCHPELSSPFFSKSLWFWGVSFNLPHFRARLVLSVMIPISFPVTGSMNAHVYPVRQRDALLQTASATFLKAGTKIPCVNNIREAKLILTQFQSIKIQNIRWLVTAQL